MTDAPINAVIVDASAVEKSSFRSYAKDRSRLRVANVAEVNGADYSDLFGIDLGGFHYDKDTSDTTTADDAGITCIVDNVGTRFIKVAVVGEINWKTSAWSSGTTYQIGDGVRYNDSSYVSLTADNLANTPAEGSAYWFLLAKAGSPGGPISIQYTFSTTTADADPGAGILRLSSATQNTSTVIRVDLLDNLGSTWTGIIDTFDDSTSEIKGFIRLSHQFDDTKWLSFTVSAVGSESGYRNITVSCVGYSAANPFAASDPLLLNFIRTGDKGETGSTGSTGATGPGYAATSTTSLATAGTGSKTFTTQAGLAYTVGARVRATSVGTSEWMEGVVTSYSGTSLQVTMDLNSGTGTNADWNINLAGQRGATGATGATGSTGATGAGLDYDLGPVADNTARDALVGVTAGQRVSVSDIGDGRSAIYELVSAGPYVWSDPLFVTGTGTSGITKCRTVALVNVAIANGLENSDTVNGVTLATGDVVLLTAQTAPEENGPYTVVASGSASRSSGFTTFDDISGSYFAILEGTTSADTLWRCTSDAGGVLETDPIVFEDTRGNTDDYGLFTGAVSGGDDYGSFV